MDFGVLGHRANGIKGKVHTTREASRLSSSTASTSDALVAIEITYADKLSGPSSAATLKVSSTCTRQAAVNSLLMHDY